MWKPQVQSTQKKTTVLCQYKNHRVSFLDACERASPESADVEHVVVLPPETGDRDVDSDIEDANDIVESDEEGYEPAGELEAEEYVSDSETSDIEGSDVDATEPCAKRRPVGGQWRKKTEFIEQLEGEDRTPVLLEFPELDGESEFELWKRFVPVGIFEEIAKQTNLYANRDKNNDKFSVTPADFAQFLGVLLLSGYNRLPRETDYWSNEPDLGVKIVAEALSRNTFQSIKSNIHFADNLNLPAGNKVAKVQLLYDSLNDQLVKCGVFHNLLSVDESMVPHYGRHSAKMYIRGKPIRFGYKI